MKDNTLSKTRRKWRTKRYTTEKRGLKMLLTFEEYQQKMIDAGITVDQIGNKLGCYVLGRYNDEGDYTVDNCRFITASENFKEGMISKPIHNLSLGGGSYDSCKGTSHYKSKGLTHTPWGIFNTNREAADHPDALCSKAAISRRIAKNIPGYFYS